MFSAAFVVVHHTHAGNSTPKGWEVADSCGLLLPLCQRFAELCNDPDHAWPRAYPCACVCYSLKYPADADQAFFEGGCPHYKTGHFTTPGFIIPDDVGLRDGRLRVSKVGWLPVVSLRVAITLNRMSAGEQNIGQGHLPASDGARRGLRQAHGNFDARGGRWRVRANTKRKRCRPGVG